MVDKLSFLLFRIGVAWNDFVKEERGETNIIAIILIIVVVIALVGIFKNNMTDLVKQLFKAIQGAFNGSEIADGQSISLPGVS